MVYDLDDVVIIIGLTIIAALLNAWSVVIQRYEAGEVDPKELFRRDFMKNLSKNPKMARSPWARSVSFFVPGCSS
ncbi:MAG: hypothetical protein WDN66_00390 [Candidatus Saccharibacteria bacterium]